MEKLRLGVMCSGNGTNFENILRTCTTDEVVLMIANKQQCGAFERAKKFGIPCAYSTNESWIINEFKWVGVDLIVLAGYMRIISPKFVEAFPNRIINMLIKSFFSMSKCKISHYISPIY